jgi:4-hydroxy-tetrahydrodipicolinate synthase
MIREKRKNVIFNFVIRMEKYNLASIKEELQLTEFPDASLDYRELGLKNPETTPENPELPKVIPALPTLYLENGAINLTALEEMIKEHSLKGIEAVLVAGTTGESSFMNEEEQIIYIKEAVKIAKKYNVKVVAGTGSNSTIEQSVLSAGAFECGADASLLLAPYYIKSSPQGILRHLWNGLDKGPGIIYSISGRTAVQIPLEVLRQLSNHPNFLGVKECDGQERIKQLADWGIKVWSGNDDTLPNDVHSYGAFGAITVAGDIDPEVVQTIIEGRASRAALVRHLTISDIIFPVGEVNPAGIHNAIEMIRRAINEGNYPAVFRDVVGPFSSKRQEWVECSLKSIGIKARVFGVNYKVFDDDSLISQDYRIPKFEK